MKLINCSTPKYPDTFAMVDDEDFDGLSRWKWYRTSGPTGRATYIVRGVCIKGTRKSYRLFMHKEILEKRFEVIDHIDGNPLNNQKANLRVCSRMENNRNRSKMNKPSQSKFKGVYRHGATFYSTIRSDNKSFYLGTFKSEQEAALAYNKAALNLHGAFALINSIEV